MKYRQNDVEDEMEYIKLNRTGDREINEDFVDVFYVGKRIVFVLADGLGGHGCGEIASKEAVEAVKKTFYGGTGEPVEKLLRDAFQNAHNMLKKLQNEVQEKSFFKTTLVILVLDDEAILWGHIGDSRLYHFEQGKLIERSMDHSVPQMLVNSGKIRERKIRYHEDRNRLTRVLGSEEENSKPYITAKEPRNQGAAFLLCSDGFWELIGERTMEKALKKSSGAQEWVQLMEQKILKAGRKRDMDNYSAVAVVL